MSRTPIEERLAAALEQEGIAFREQITIGPFSVDFIVSSHAGKPIFIVECDGAEYHDATRDAERDAQIMKQVGMEVVRFSGKQIKFSLPDCLRVVKEKLSLHLETPKSPASTFDPGQAETVSAPLGPMLVYAPAGSGKTRVLIGRIVYLVQKCGIPPGRICALTFTRDAASEMRSRLAETLSASLAEQIVVDTFHALAGKLRVSAGRNVVDDDRRLALVTAAARRANCKIPALELANAISRKKADLLDVTAYARQVSDEPQKASSPNSSNTQFVQAWQFYENELSKSRECDYDDLLLWLAVNARNDNQWAEKLSTLFDYVLVDEAQDNNRAQDEILRVLTSRHSHYMVVGDDDQSVYGFRGAQPNLFRDKESIPGIQVRLLQNNYRSHPTIVLTALGFITGSNERRLKAMHPKRIGTGVPIEWIERIGPVDEARAIAARIAELLTEGRRPGDVAVLVRSNYQSEVITNELSTSGIPVINYSHDSVLRKLAAQVLISYLKVVAGEGKWEDWSRAIRFPNRYIPRELWTEIQDSEDVLGLWEARAKRLMDTDKAWIGERWQEEIDRFRQLSSAGNAAPWRRIKELRDHFSLDGAFDQLIDGKVVFSGKPHLDYVQSMAKSFRTTADLFDYCAALNRSDRSSASGSRVHVMTIHKAKGLEFPIVFLAELNHDQFPHPNGNQAEERRLCYVAITRAREKLVLCADPQCASSFVAEIKRCTNKPVDILVDRGTQLPRLAYRVGDSVFDDSLRKKLLVTGYSSLHGIYVQDYTGYVQWVSDSAASQWHLWFVRTTPGALIDGTKFKIGQRVMHWCYGVGIIMEYRSDQGFLVNFFTQEVWMPHTRGIAELEVQ